MIFVCHPVHQKIRNPLEYTDLKRCPFLLLASNRKVEHREVLSNLSQSAKSLMQLLEVSRKPYEISQMLCFDLSLHSLSYKPHFLTC
jgi:hypothetical protein